jgi:ribosomal protein S14
MKYLVRKDKKKRNFMYNRQLDNIIIKSILKNFDLPQTIRWNATVIFSQWAKKYFKNVIKNRCVYTNRGRSVFRFFKLSRLSFTFLLKNSNIANIKKASW